MKSVTLTLRTGDDAAAVRATLLNRVKACQQLGFENIDLVLEGAAPLRDIATQVRGAGGRLRSIRLRDGAAKRRDANVAGFSRLASVRENIRAASVESVLNLCAKLAGTDVRTVVIESGRVDVPGADTLESGVEAALEDDVANDARTLMAQAVELRTPRAHGHLEALCRSLFELTRKTEGIGFSVLTPGSPLDVCLPDEMEQLLGEFKNGRVSYWHSTCAARKLEKLGLADAESWLARFGSRMSGVYLSDAVGAQGDQAPGIGEVDFKRLKPWLGKDTARVLAIADDGSGSKLKFGTEHLSNMGIF